MTVSSVTHPPTWAAKRHIRRINLHFCQSIPQSDFLSEWFPNSEPACDASLRSGTDRSNMNFRKPHLFWFVTKTRCPWLVHGLCGVEGNRFVQIDHRTEWYRGRCTLTSHLRCWFPTEATQTQKASRFCLYSATRKWQLVCSWSITSGQPHRVISGRWHIRNSFTPVQNTSHWITSLSNSLLQC